MVLQAESTTQSALSLSCATSLAFSRPSSSSVGLAGTVRASDGSGTPLTSPATTACVAIIGERRTLYRGHGRIRTKEDVAGGRAECLRNSLELIGRVGELRQRVHQHVAMETSASA